MPDPESIDGLVVMGGPMSVHDDLDLPWIKEEKRWLKEFIKLEKPALGICLGAQLLAHALDARVHPHAQKEIGWFPIQLTRFGRTWKGLEGAHETITVFHWHGETFDLPARAQQLAFSSACQQQGFVWKDRVVGLQFHFESTPESVADIVKNCENELIKAPYIQSVQTILTSDIDFEEMHAVMFHLLDYLMGE